MDFVDEIYKTIDVMIQRYVSKMKISQQVNGVVMGESGKNDNRYKVKVNGEIYTVKDGIGIKPANNTNVWICVPNNDWHLAYICGGRNASMGYVTEEALKSTRQALEAEIQEVYDECITGCEITSAKLIKVIQAGSNVFLSESNNKLIISAAGGVSDVMVDNISVVSNGIARIDTADLGKVKDVKVNGTTVVDEDGVANVLVPTPPTIPVTDVTVDGVTVLNGTVAQLNTSSLNKVNDIRISGISVVNSSGIANIPPNPTIPVTDVTLDGTSLLDGTIAKLNSSSFGTTVVANPQASATTNLNKLQVGNTVYDVVSETELSTAISTLQASFQDGVDAIYNACVAKGSTPASHSLSDVVTAIYAISGDDNYREVNSTLNTNMRYFGNAKERNE